MCTGNTQIYNVRARERERDRVHRPKLLLTIVELMLYLSEALKEKDEE